SRQARRSRRIHSYDAPDAPKFRRLTEPYRRGEPSEILEGHPVARRRLRIGPELYEGVISQDRVGACWDTDDDRGPVRAEGPKRARRGCPTECRAAQSLRPGPIDIAQPELLARQERDLVRAGPPQCATPTRARLRLLGGEVGKRPPRDVARLEVHAEDELGVGRRLDRLHEDAEPE